MITRHDDAEALIRATALGCDVRMVEPDRQVNARMFAALETRDPARFHTMLDRHERTRLYEVHVRCLGEHTASIPGAYTVPFEPTQHAIELRRRIDDAIANHKATHRAA